MIKLAISKYLCLNMFCFCSCFILIKLLAMRASGLGMIMRIICKFSLVSLYSDLKYHNLPPRKGKKRK